jgi:hypothetical protein
MDSVKKREDEATSKETLEDLENESTLTGDEADQTDETGGPSPDGAFDEADEISDADPI